MSAQQAADAGAPPSLLAQRPFRFYSYSRFTSRVAQNALNFGLVLLIVDETGKAIYSSLLVITLVLPATVVGLFAGLLADTFPKRPLVFLGNVARAAICFMFIRDHGGVLGYYIVAILLASAGQLATAAEAAMAPLVVERRNLARANAIGQGVGVGAQLLGFAVLTPVALRLFRSEDVLFGITGVLFLIAAGQILVAGRVKKAERELVIGGEAGPRWWLVGWRELRRDRQVTQAAVELTLISTVLIILGGLIPKYIEDVLGLPVDVGAVVLLPAAAGMVLGLRVAAFLAHRVPHALLSTIGFGAFVCLLAGLTFVNEEASFLAGYGLFGWLLNLEIGSFDGGGILATLIMLPLGFAYAMVAVAAQTVLNDRVPVHLQGRVLATQGAVAAVAASLPVLLAGALSDVIGVTPVMAVVALGIGLAAVSNLRGPRPQQTTPRRLEVRSR